MLASLLLLSALASSAPSSGQLVRDFTNPPDAAKPWCYWWWLNGHADRASITSDLETMKRLGFGGLLMFDSRGYWDDEDHLPIPKARIGFMSDEWRSLVIFAIREAARLGLRFSMNMSPSGGKLDGPWPVGADAPKRLVYRFCREGDDASAPGLPHYRDICTRRVWYRGADVVIDGVWRNGGDGIHTMQASVLGRQDEAVDDKVRVLAHPGDADARSVFVRFGFATLPGHDYDVDVLDPGAITGHFNRFQGALQSEIPELVGRDRTLVALYSCSWEGPMPTWTGDFEREFRARTGYAIRPLLPLLAGFTSADGETDLKFRRDYRRVRNDMFKDNFYGRMRDLAHERNLDWYSESGGPWRRDPELFREADQLEFLSVNDYPQGEFWPLIPKVYAADGGRANANARLHVRGAVSAAHAYGRRIASAEAFSHMHHHWSVDPAFLKPVGDQAFADGINRLVWHTFTLSPPQFGVPGAEYFAGSHLNGNVTWCEEAEPFVRYLGRCQALLQAGEPVTDIAVLAGDRTYVGRWGRFRSETSDEETEAHIYAKVPEGFAYDLVNDAALRANPGLTNGYSVVYDVRRPENRNRTIPVGGLKPDVENAGSLTWCHRRIGVTDVYFLAGEGPCEPVFRAQSRAVEVWDAVNGCRAPADGTRLSDGRTRVRLCLPKGGSAFVLFLDHPTATAPGEAFGSVQTVEGPWQVSFAYHRGLTAAPPAPVTIPSLVDFTTREDLKHFSGTAVYRATFVLPEGTAGNSFALTLGDVPSGLARVFVNRKDCGVAWCAPWRVDVSSAVRSGTNELEIRYVNNWINRLIGDCFLPAAERVTTSTLRYGQEPRSGNVKDFWSLKPTVFSGYSISDPLERAGILGPVRLERASVTDSDRNCCR